MAYTGVIDQAYTIIRNIDLAILRRNSKSARMARDFYRMSRTFANETEAGQLLKPVVLDARRALVGVRRKKPVLAETPQPAAAAAAAK